MEKNQAYTHLICAAQNMKNIAIKRNNIENNKEKCHIISNILMKVLNFIKFMKNLLHKKTSVLKTGVCLHFE